MNFTSKGFKDKYILCAHSIIGIQSEADSLVTPFLFDYSAQAPMSIEHMEEKASISPTMSAGKVCFSLPSPLNEFFEPYEQKPVLS